MLISFVLRLAPAALAAGDLAGEVEHVTTGERGQFRDAVELAGWCAHVASPPRLLELPEPRPNTRPLLHLPPHGTS